MLFSIKILILLIPVLLSVAFVTLMERKVLSLVGTRLGPNKVSFIGLLQPVSDAMKLMNKSFSYTSNLSSVIFYTSSFICLMFSLALWYLMSSEPQGAPFSLSIMFFMIVLSINCLGAILCGWSSYCKYSLVGSLRGVAQLISYESVLYLLLFFILYFYETLSAYSLSSGAAFPCLFLIPLFYCWLPTMLAELNRTPYDFSEGESELVSGFNTEFGAQPFTFIFLSEYSSIIFFSLISSLLFGLSFYDFSFFFFFFFCYLNSLSSSSSSLR